MGKSSREFRFYTERNDLLELVPREAQTILDVGCGTGLLAKALKKRGAREVFGIESSEHAAKKAEKYLDKVIVGDVEKTSLNFPKKFFDCIIYADVLEHLLEPEKLLREYKSLLADDGCIVLSIPNVSYIKVLFGLLKDEWFLSDNGILCRGHLRFFTFKTIKKTLDKAGYKIVLKKEKIRPLKPKIDFFNIVFHSINFFLMVFLRRFMIYQYLIVAKKKKND